MKLEIKLKDPKYCDDCPYHRIPSTEFICEFFGFILKREVKPETPVNGATDITHSYHIIRPQKCIKENGR